MHLISINRKLCVGVLKVCVYVRLYIYRGGGGSEKNVLHEVGGAGKMKYGIPNFAPAPPPPPNNDRSLIAGCPQGESRL